MMFQGLYGDTLDHLVPKMHIEVENDGMASDLEIIPGESFSARPPLRTIENDMHSGLPLGGRTPYITSKNRLRTLKLHIKDVPRTSENSLVRPKMDIETSCRQKKPAHIYQIT